MRLNSPYLYHYKYQQLIFNLVKPPSVFSSITAAPLIPISTLLHIMSTIFLDALTSSMKIIKMAPEENTLNKESSPDTSQTNTSTHMNKSYSAVVHENASAKMEDKSSFLHLKFLTESKNNYFNNKTVQGDNTSTPKYLSQRMIIIFTVPKAEDDADED